MAVCHDHQAAFAVFGLKIAMLDPSRGSLIQKFPKRLKEDEIGDEDSYDE